ncbi:hypothetical protein V6Z11_D05G388100 [Gossypium hirsutum]
MPPNFLKSPINPSIPPLCQFFYLQLTRQSNFLHTLHFIYIHFTHNIMPTIITCSTPHVNTSIHNHILHPENILASIDTFIQLYAYITFSFTIIYNHKIQTEPRDKNKSKTFKQHNNQQTPKSGIRNSSVILRPR